MSPQVGARVLGRVAVTERLGALHWVTVEVPSWESGSDPGRPGPGQFALLQAEPSRCFLPRAFSISDYEGGLVSFLIAPVGHGSRELCELPAGAEVWVLGPLGRGFDLGTIAAARTSAARPQAKMPARLVIVAGGAGLAPFPFLLRRLGGMAPAGPVGVRANGEGFDEILVLLGYRESTQVAGGRPVHVAAERLRERGVDCRVLEISEDGSTGRAGLVTSLLCEHLRSGDRVVVCGPGAMAEAVWEICRETPDVRTWFSLEAGMACGVGACHGCVVPLADGTMARVCHEGPVFPGETIFSSGGGLGTGATLGGAALGTEVSPGTEAAASRHPLVIGEAPTTGAASAGSEMARP